MRESPPRPGDEGAMDGSLGGRQGGYEPLVDPTYRRLERPDPASLFVVAGQGKTWRDDKRAPCRPYVAGRAARRTARSTVRSLKHSFALITLSMSIGRGNPLRFPRRRGRLRC